MNISRLFFYLLIAFIIYMLIGHVVRTTRMDQEKEYQAQIEEPNETNQQPSKALQELDKTMREGLLAMRKGDKEEGEKQFLIGRSLANSLDEQEFYNHFTLMLVNTYLDIGALDKAEALLKEASTQPGIDQISYHNQLIILYEKQGDYAKMCYTLSALDEALSSLSCDLFQEDIAILEAQKDEAAIQAIFRKPTIEAIVNCAGKNMIKQKMADNECQKNGVRDHAKPE